MEVIEEAQSWRQSEAAIAPNGGSSLRLLARLLSYLPPHTRPVLLTMAFGSAGFLLSFAYPWIIGGVIDLAVADVMAPAMRRSELIWLGELGAATAVLHALAVYGRGHFSVTLSHGVITDLRRDLFAHLQTLSTAFYARERTGAITSRILHDVHDASGLIYAGIVVALMDAAQLALAFTLLSSISHRLAWVCIMVFPLYGLVFFAMGSRVRHASERLRVRFSRWSADLTEQLAGQALVKTHTAEARELRRFETDTAELHELVVAQSRSGHLASAFSELLVDIGTTLVIGYGGWLMLGHDLTPGALTRFLGYVVILYGPVRRFAELHLTYQSSLSAMRRVQHVFDLKPAVVDRPGAHGLPPARGAVCFDAVHFRYHSSESEQLDDLTEHAGLDAVPSHAGVLHGISLDVEPGECVALVGSSGSGKTTLVSLLPRLHDACQGRVLIDGRDVRDYELDALRSAIAIVQQDAFLFSGSVRDNLTYGRPDASDGDIEAAARAAHAHDFIMALPSGYDTRLGERGVNLSGGQRQRLSIARALLRDPKILILDEATSALDPESEAIVQVALERLMEGRTCFVIAHRLSTIRRADRILVLEDGRIVESGSHSELVQFEGRYAQLVRAQQHAPRSVPPLERERAVAE